MKRGRYPREQSCLVDEYGLTEPCPLKACYPWRGAVLVCQKHAQWLTARHGRKRTKEFARRERRVTTP